MMANDECGEQRLVSNIVKLAHSVETNLYNICLKILNEICNTSWKTDGFIFSTLADDCAGFLLSIVMTLFLAETGSLYD